MDLQIERLKKEVETLKIQHADLRNDFNNITESKNVYVLHILNM